MPVAHTGQMLLLVPADPLRPRRADEHFAAEAAAARDAGHDVALIDHDLLAEPDGARRAVARVPPGGRPAVYRRYGPAVPDVCPWAVRQVLVRGLSVSCGGRMTVRSRLLPVIAPPAAVRRTGAPAMARHSGPADQD